jgi:hypothetical protein
VILAIRTFARRHYAEVVDIEVLYFEGCPNHEPLIAHVRDLMREASVAGDVRVRRVDSQRDAERERFLGSPTLRIDGRDVEPAALQRTDFGLRCRLFATPGGLRGVPADEWVLAALGRAARRR